MDWSNKIQKPGKPEWMGQEAYSLLIKHFSHNSFLFRSAPIERNVARNLSEGTEISNGLVPEDVTDSVRYAIETILNGVVMHHFNGTLKQKEGALQKLRLNYRHSNMDEAAIEKKIEELEGRLSEIVSIMRRQQYVKKEPINTLPEPLQQFTGRKVRPSWMTEEEFLWLDEWRHFNNSFRSGELAAEEARAICQKVSVVRGVVGSQISPDHEVAVSNALTIICQGVLAGEREVMMYGSLRLAIQCGDDGSGNHVAGNYTREIVKRANEIRSVLGIQQHKNMER